MTYTAVFETASELTAALEVIRDEGGTIVWHGREDSGWYVAQYEVG